MEAGRGDDGAAKTEERKVLELAECEGLPREMTESDGVTEHVFQRMDFLWRASNCLRLVSPAVSRIYSDQLRKLCAEYEARRPGSGPLLPEWVSDSLCNSCGGILTPGITCRIRVRHRSLASPSVKKAKAKTRVEKTNTNKCRNEVVTTCLTCGGINTRGGTERQARDKKRRRRGGSRGRKQAVRDSGEGIEALKGKKRNRDAATLRGDYIPLGGGSLATPPTIPSRKRVAQTPSSNKRVGGSESGNGDGDSGASKSVHHNRRGKSGGSGSGGDAISASGEEGKGEAGVAPPALSLLERIRRDKKKKRRHDAASAAATAE
ncbi:conserved unknown protein [Ectocarpus siliculosus]|uniref:Uncharacterized protein n=1 Tax=Ectocarpus siliculosus TaxID=2880 RepID=D7FLR2_ECTSI|nr:conserved unknown protein [Ectocarpus siliculosus]|eukprot:CBJ29737.1 conserved unknown protein [Ectocarpus siliculosus]